MKALTVKDVLEIRRDYKVVQGRFRTSNVLELSQRYGVSQETIRKIAKKKMYARVY